MGDNILAGIVANIITTTVFTILGIGTLFVVFITERQALFRFFGISSDKPNIHIYVSRVEVAPGGSRGSEPLTAGYVGPTIIRIEYLAALLIRGLFRSKILALLPKRLRELFSRFHVTFTDIDPIIDASPIDLTEDIFADNLILIGSGIYNYVSLHYFKQPSSPYYFGKDTKGERIMKVRRDTVGDLELEGRSFHRELAVLQRINDHDHGVTVFICAGLGSSASFGSVRYLVRHWRKLQYQYGQSEFAFCLMFDKQPPDGESVVEPKKIHEKPIDFM